MRLLLLCIVLLLGACGYHFSNPEMTLPGGVERIHIVLIDNQTREPLLENRLTSEIIEIISGHSNVHLVAHETAEAILTGRILSYDHRALSYQQEDQIGRYRASMVVSVRLERSNTQALLWEGTVSWQTEYATAVDKMLQGDAERRAQDELARRLAEEVFTRMLDDF